MQATTGKMLDGSYARQVTEGSADATQIDSNGEESSLSKP